MRVTHTLASFWVHTNVGLFALAARHGTLAGQSTHTRKRRFHCIAERNSKMFFRDAIYHFNAHLLVLSHPTRTFTQALANTASSAVSDLI